MRARARVVCAAAARLKIIGGGGTRVSPNAASTECGARARRGVRRAARAQKAVRSLGGAVQANGPRAVRGARRCWTRAPPARVAVVATILAPRAPLRDVSAGAQKCSAARTGPHQNPRAAGGTGGAGGRRPGGQKGGKAPPRRAPRGSSAWGRRSGAARAEPWQRGRPARGHGALPKRRGAAARQGAARGKVQRAGAPRPRAGARPRAGPRLYSQTRRRRLPPAPRRRAGARAASGQPRAPRVGGPRMKRQPPGKPRVSLRKNGLGNRSTDVSRRRACRPPFSRGQMPPPRLAGSTPTERQGWEPHGSCDSARRAPPSAGARRTSAGQPWSPPAAGGGRFAAASRPSGERLPLARSRARRAAPLSQQRGAARAVAPLAAAAASRRGAKQAPPQRRPLTAAPRARPRSSWGCGSG